MNTSQEIKDIAAALAKAQGAIEPAAKDTENPFFHSKYADFAALKAVCRGPLRENGLSVVQDVTTDADCVRITTRILHSSGQWIECGPLSVPLVKKDPQSVGSATSYGKRYGYGAALGVVAEVDDDGEAAMGRGKNGNGRQEVPAPYTWTAHLPKPDVDAVMAVAKDQWGGKGYDSKVIAAHLNKLARQLDPLTPEALCAAIKETSPEK